MKIDWNNVNSKSIERKTNNKFYIRYDTFYSNENEFTKLLLYNENTIIVKKIII